MKKLSIHFWDMDHTIINNDCDVSWKEFLIQEKIAPESIRQTIDKFYDDYKAGCLDPDEFMDFQLQEFVGKTQEEIAEICELHFLKIVKETIYPQAEEMIKAQLANGELVCLITATNTAIAKALADYLEIPHLIATQLELKDGLYTGKLADEYCAGSGKVKYIKEFCQKHELDYQAAGYYGDSKVDIEVMTEIPHPRPCNPAQELEEAAIKNSWPILKF